MEQTRWAFDEAKGIDRFRQFIAFADWWFEDHPGERELADLDIDAALDGFEIPLVLREFYEAAKRWPVKRMQHYFGWNQNFFAYPNQLGDSETFAEHGLLQFAYENQGVTTWACPPGDDDPAVYDREYERHVSDQAHASYPGGRCSASLADFLIDFLLVEFALNGQVAGSLPRFVKQLDEDPSLEQRLRWNALNGHAHVGLVWDEILTLRLGRSDGEPGWTTPRGDAGRALLRPFAGAVGNVTFRWSVGDVPDSTKWFLSIGAKGACHLSGSHTNRRRSTDQFAVQISAHELASAVAEHVDPGPSEPGVVTVAAQYEGRPLLNDDEVMTNGQIRQDLFRPILQECIDAITEPSVELAPQIQALLAFEPNTWPAWEQPSKPTQAAEALQRPKVQDWVEPPNDHAAALMETVWKFPGTATYVTFLRGGEAHFKNSDVRFKMDARGRWKVGSEGVVEADCNNFTLYEFEVEGDRMEGHTFRAKTPASKATSSLERVKPSEKC